jgi:hypothetical protein
MAPKLAALYYPHMGIKIEGFLKNALLLWDEVNFICPFHSLPYRSQGEAQDSADRTAPCESLDFLGSLWIKDWLPGLESNQRPTD